MTGFFSTLPETTFKENRTIPRCGSCGLSANCHSPKMPPTGEGKRKILVLAEAPGKEEDKRNVQLIGESGQLLRKMLTKLGVDLDQDCRKTNTVCCRPEGNETPSPQQIEACLPNVVKELKQRPPNVIILLGSCAIAAIIGREWRKELGSLGKWVGWAIPSRKWNAWICPTYHPAYLLRQRDKVLDNIVIKNLDQAVRLAASPPWPKGAPDEKGQVEILEEKQAQQVLEQIWQTGGTVALDYETTGLKPDSSSQRIVSCSLCWNGTRTVAFMMADSLRKPLRALLRTERVGKIASNLKFEERWSRAKLGTGVNNWVWDTMLASHVLDNRPGITSIKFQAYVRLGLADYDSHLSDLLKRDEPNSLNRIHEIPSRELLLYNGLDSLLEYEVACRQMKEMGFPWTTDPGL